MSFYGDDDEKMSDIKLLFMHNVLFRNNDIYK